MLIKEKILYRLKRCGNNYKDEDNSPKALNDENYQASSQKFRQLRNPMYCILNFFFSDKVTTRKKCLTILFVYFLLKLFWEPNVNE